MANPLYTASLIVIALVVGFYWARVIKLVLKQRRQTGRDANFVPRERLGRWLRVIWYPTVGAWCLLPWVSALIFAGAWTSAPRLLQPLHRSDAVAVVCAAVAVAALAATMVCWRRMGRSWRMGIDPGEKTTLVFTGPFAYVRHPIYALSSLLMIATAAAVASPVMLLVAGFHLMFLQWEAHREERYLLVTHGEGYAAYRRHVGRMIPRSLSPYRPA